MVVVENAGVTSTVSSNWADPNVQNNFDHQPPKQPQQKMGEVELQNEDINGNGVSVQKTSLARNMDHVNGNGEKGLEKEMRDLEDMLSKLNPTAKEFVLPSFGAANQNYILMPVALPNGMHFGYIQLLELPMQIETQRLELI